MSMNIYAKYRPKIIIDNDHTLTGPNFSNINYNRMMRRCNEWLMNWSDDVTETELKNDLQYSAHIFHKLACSPYEVHEVSLQDLLVAIHKVFAFISYEKAFVGNENLALPDEEVFTTMNRLNQIAAFLIDIPRDAKVYGL